MTAVSTATVATEKVEVMEQQQLKVATVHNNKYNS